MCGVRELWRNIDDEQARAIAVWKEGQMMNAENQTLKDTLQRLRVKL